MAEQFRAGPAEVHTIGGDRRLLVALRTGRALEASKEDADLLLSCRFFRPLDRIAADEARSRELASARRLTAKGPRWLRAAVRRTEQTVKPDPQRMNAVRATLIAFVESGLLVSRSSFLQEARRHGAPAAPPPIRTVGFTTRNRPELLQRAIRSWVANAAPSGRDVAFTVIDDSRSEDEERPTREALAELVAEGVAVRFAGPRERDAYAQALAAEADAAPSLVSFALRGDPRFPLTTGSARNSLLLDSAGEPYVLADDDGVARLAACPEPLDGFEITSRNDATDFWFYRNRDEMLAQGLFVEKDVLGEHERLLGRSACDLLGANGAEPSLELMSVDFEDRLRRGPVTVRTSMAGVIGDSGIGATAHLFTSPEARRRLTLSEEFYHDAVRNRQSLRVARRPTLGDGIITMAGNLGLDAAALLPPFCPIQRNSDGLLGRTLRQCFPDACRGYLDVAALHDPPHGRSQSLEEYWDQVRRLRFPDVLGSFIDAWAPPPGSLSPAQGLALLGERLREVGRLPQSAFRGLLRAQQLRKEAPRLAFDRTGEASEMPEFYARLRQRQLEVLRQAVACDSYLEPRDLPFDDPLAETQAAIGRFGELLIAWPRIWQAALRLRAAGGRLARPLG
ncbi:MAG: hypothetical protein GC160_24140 [Acidobacteria bacterium]|nr:hypothetical protein [Acidobacteriota bacterium]